MLNVFFGVVLDQAFTWFYFEFTDLYGGKQRMNYDVVQVNMP